MSGTPSPADLAGTIAIQPSDGPSGDASLDAQLHKVDSAVSEFLHAQQEDAAEVLAAGGLLHDALQRRLDEAAG